jgi:hypothetical protein
MLAEISAWSWRAWRWRGGWCASLSAAAPFAFADVLAFATIVAGLATALTLALVLAFASVFALFSIGHCLQRHAGFCTSGARGVCTYREGSCQKAGNCCAGDHCFGWSNHLLALSFVWLVSGRLRDATPVGRRRSNIQSSICACVGIFIDAVTPLLFPKMSE